MYFSTGAITYNFHLSYNLKFDSMVSTRRQHTMEIAGPGEEHSWSGNDTSDDDASDDHSGDEGKDPKRQRVDDDSEVPVPDQSSWRVSDNLFNNNAFRNANVPDSKLPSPEPLPTGPSNIDPVTGDPIASASDSGSEDDIEDGGDNEKDDDNEEDDDNGDGDGDSDGNGHGNSNTPLGAPIRPSRQAILDRIRVATIRLNELTANHRDCNCPPNCSGPNPLRPGLA